MCWVSWDSLTLPKYAGGLGFRDIETFNDALLAKIGWRIITEPQSLVAQVLMGKYSKYTSFMDCQAPANTSHGWRSILAGREILRKGLSWVIGSGEKVKIWKDPWLSCKEPITPIGPPNKEDGDRLVCELLCPISNQWDRDKIRCFIPQYENQIMQLATSYAPSVDRLVWMFEKSGNYSTKTGYGIGINNQAMTPSSLSTFNWTKSIWNVKTPPKIKDFLWKVVRRVIPVSSNLEIRGLPAFSCSHCGGHEDDLHVFLLCPLADQVWNLAPVIHRPHPNLPSMSVFIQNAPFLTVLPPVGLSTPLWPWLLWNLWKARNKLCFEKRKFSAMEIMLKAISDAKEWQDAQMSVPPEASLLPHSSQRSRPHTIPPLRPNMVVCNVDAAWNSNSENCGIGCVFSGTALQDSVVSESRRFVSSALMAEAFAIRSAVMYAASSNVKDLMILSDCLSLVKLLREGGSTPALFGVLFDINYFSMSFEAVSFYHVPRLSNVQANSVAKSALVLLDSTSSIRG